MTSPVPALEIPADPPAVPPCGCHSRSELPLSHGAPLSRLHSCPRGRIECHSLGAEEGRRLFFCFRSRRERLCWGGGAGMRKGAKSKRERKENKAKGISRQR